MLVLNKKYAPLISDNSRYFPITGGRGSGKSFTVNTILCLMLLEEKQRILFLRQTLTSAYLSIIPEFQEKIELLGLDNLFDITKTEIINKTNGNAILFRGIQTGSKSNTANLKSLQGINVLVIDEAEEVTDETVFDRIDLSVRQKGVQNRVILIMNPATKEHFIYKRFFESMGVNPGWNGKKDNVTYIHTDYRDNIENLDPSFLSQVEIIKNSNPSKYEHVILGGWLDAAEGVIYSNWKIGEFNNDLSFSFGADFGFSFDETTLVKCAVDKKRKIVYLKECVYETGLSTNDIYLKYFREAGYTSLITADSAEPRLISELSANGLNIIPAIKGPGSITAGIAAIQDYQLIIDPISKNLIKELNNYVWHDKKSSTPIDAYNHLLDAVRYCVYPLIKNDNLGLETQAV